MRIGVIGSGYVGLVTSACLADSGNHVMAIDNDESKIAELSAGRCPIFEPGLEELLGENLRAGRLRFSTDLAEGVRGARVVFIAVGTPPRRTVGRPVGGGVCGGADRSHDRLTYDRGD